MSWVSSRTISFAALLFSLAPVVTHAAWMPNGNAVGDVSIEQIHPHAFRDGRGGALVSWTEGFASRLQHFIADGAYAPDWPSSGELVPPSQSGFGPDRVREAGAIADGSGGAFVALFYGTCGQSCNFDPGQLLLQRVTASGSIAPGWLSSGVPLERPLVDALIVDRLRLAPDGRRGVLVAWDNALKRYPQAPRLVATQRVSADGTLLWGTDGVVCALGAAVIGAPALVADGEGGALVFWGTLDSATAMVTVRGQHISALGRVL